MAYESNYWRQLIKRDVRYLDKKLKLSHKDIESDIDKHFSEVEIKIMTLAFAIRKLADSHKLPDITLVKEIRLNKYPRIKSFERRAFVDIEREYDLSAKKEILLSLREMSNQIIHSYILQAVGSSRRSFKYIWFVSDRKKDCGLYEIEIKKLLEALLKVTDSFIKKMSLVYDYEKNDWIRNNS